ncbi:MAG: hypothetical protein H6851_17920 [Geminicoccaceae bacterium]|nr:hypothetical protein [Geminicoccaceae bacterium]
MTSQLSFEGAQFDVFVYAPPGRVEEVSKLFERDLNLTPISGSRMESLLPEFLTRPLAVIVAILSVIPEKAEKQAAFLVEAAMGRPVIALSRNSEAQKLIHGKGIRDVFNDNLAIIDILPRLTCDVVQRLTAASVSLRLLQAQRNAEQVAGILLNQSRCPLAIVGKSGVIRRCADPFAVMFGQPASELIGKDVDSLIYTEDEDPLFDIRTGRCMVENVELAVHIKNNSGDARIFVKPLPSSPENRAWLVRFLTETEMTQAVDMAGSGLLSGFKGLDSKGVPITGALHGITLDEIRHRLGDKYHRLENTVHQTFESVIRHSIKPNDSFVRLNNGDYLIAWLSTGSETAAGKTREITLKIMARLFGNDEPAQAVRTVPPKETAIANKVPAPRPLPRAEIASRDSPDLVTAALRERKAAACSTSERTLSKNLPRIGVTYRSLDLADLTPTDHVYATPNSAGQEAIRTMMHGNLPTDQVMRAVDQHMLELVIDDLSIGNLSPGVHVLLDVSLTTLARPVVRDPYLALLQTHGHLTRRQVIINVNDFDQSTYEGRIAQAMMVASPYSLMRSVTFDTARLRSLAQSTLQAQMLVVDYGDWAYLARQPKTARAIALQLRQNRQKLVVRNSPPAGIQAIDSPLVPDFVADN